VNAVPAHPLRCRCGAVKGQVDHPERAMGRGACYCRDCQAFAHFLGQPTQVLDAAGGTDVVATQPQHVTITQGRDKIACMSLSPKGLLRWYASCCRTPIGNTSRSAKTPYVGLVHSCLDNRAQAIDRSFGPVTLRLNTQSARGPVPETSKGMFGTMVRSLWAMMRARLGGGWRQTPFFEPGSGAPIVTPQVIGRDERERLMRVL
jgi:hypothetical protein